MSDRENNVVKWAMIEGFPPNMVGKESITSPDWCDSSTWPVSTLDSTWTVTAKSISGRATDDRIVMITKGVVRFCGAVIHSGGEMKVEYLVGDTVVDTTIYASRKDFEKRSTSMSVIKAEDAEAGKTGDVWNIELDFLAESKPLILRPLAEASLDPLKVTGFRLYISDHTEYHAKANAGEEYAYVRYPDIRLFSLPQTIEEIIAEREAAGER